MTGLAGCMLQDDSGVMGPVGVPADTEGISTLDFHHHFATDAASLGEPNQLPALATVIGGPDRYWLSGSEAWQQRPANLPIYTEGNLPSSGDAGQEVFNSDRTAKAFDDGEMWKYPAITEHVLTNPQTVDNTTTETEVYNAELSPDSIKVDRVYRFTFSGSFQVANTSDSFEWRVKIGGTEIASVFSTGGNVPAGSPWKAVVDMTVQNNGDVVTIQPYTEARFNNEPSDNDHPTVDVDTTIAESITGTITWDAAEPDNTATISQGYMENLA